MVIESIADNLELLATIGQWHWDEWGHADPEGNAESWIEGLSQRIGRDQIPTTYVALSNKRELLGSVSLVENDMDTRPDLRPWLAGLYVPPSAREHGVGSALTLHAMERTKAMGINQLYLYTAKAESLYSRLGWTTIDRDIFEGDDVAIMSFKVD